MAIKSKKLIKSTNRNAILVILLIAFVSLGIFFKNTNNRAVNEFKCEYLTMFIPTDEDTTDRCYMDLSQKLDDPIWCQNDTICLAAFAGYKKNPNLCFDFGFTETEVKNCILQVFYKVKDSKICGLIKENDYKEYCIEEARSTTFPSGGIKRVPQ